MTDLFEDNLLEEALAHVSRKKTMPGIDGMKGKELPAYWAAHREDLCKRILRANYRPDPFLAIGIRKPDSKEKRKLEIPTVQDRMILYALSTILNRYYEPRFCPESYGFRPGRSCHSALEDCLKRLETGAEYIIDLDIRKFFDRVDHEILLSILKRDIQNRGLLILIERFIRILIARGLQTYRKKRGLSQGSALSPILANVYLHELDQYMESRQMSFVRYADDIVVFCQTRLEAYRQMELCRDFLANNLRLEINEGKTRIVRPWELAYLGYSFDSDLDKEGRSFQLSIGEKTRRHMTASMLKNIRRARAQRYSQYIDIYGNMTHIGLYKNMDICRMIGDGFL